MYLIYKIFCYSGVIYIGITSNLEHRWKQHKAGYGASVTKRYKPLSIEVLETGLTYEEATELERYLVILLRKDGIRAYGGPYTDPKKPAIRRNFHGTERSGVEC